MSGAIDTPSRFSPKEPKRSSSRKHSSLSPAVTNSPSIPKFVRKMHVFPLLLQLWDTLWALWHQDNSRTCCAHLPSTTSILEMRSGWFNSYNYRPADSLGGFIKRLCDRISTEKALITIWSWRTRIVHYKPVQIPIDVPWPPQLNCTSRLSCHLKVLVPPVPLSSSTAVTTTHFLWEHQLGISWLHAEKTLNTDLWHTKSLFAGLVGLRAWI